jgi:hypothetical protein
MRSISFIPKIIMCPVGQLKAAPFNPERRTEDQRRMRQLEEAITEAGGIVAPIIVSNDYRIIDGHRRLQAAKNLGYVEVPVIVSPLSLQVGWRVLNAYSMNVVSGDWVSAHYLGMAIENIPVVERRRITEIMRLIGEDGLAKIAERGASSGVLDEAKRVARYIEDKARTQPPGDDMVRAVLLWMVELNQQFPARVAVRSGMNRQLLRYSIENKLELSKSAK